jgi:hypothetical protein
MGATRSRALRPITIVHLALPIVTVTITITPTTVSVVTAWFGRKRVYVTEAARSARATKAAALPRATPSPVDATRTHEPPAGEFQIPYPLSWRQSLG